MDEESCLSFLVRHAWLSMRTVVAGALAEHELSVSQYGTLICVRDQPGCTVAEVARKVGTARQSANEMLAGLERSGLVERRSHPNDRRSQQVYQTKDGEDRLAAAGPAVRKVEAALQDDFTPEERALAKAWLQKMAESAVPGPEELKTL